MHYVEFGPRSKVTSVLTLKTPSEGVWSCLHPTPQANHGCPTWPEGPVSPVATAHAPPGGHFVHMRVCGWVISFVFKLEVSASFIPLSCFFFLLNRDYFLFLDQVEGLAFSFFL